MALEYKLLNPEPRPDKMTSSAIESSVAELVNLMDHFSAPQDERRIVVDNRAIAIESSKIIMTTVGYVLGHPVLYLKSPKGISQIVKLPTYLDEMDQEEINAFDSSELYGNVNPQLLVALRDYSLERQK